MCGHALKHLLGPVGDIIGVALSVAGFPEFGIPLAAASSAGGEALSGGKPLQDILAGVGGGLGAAVPVLGPALGGALGIGTTAADALIGAGAGALQGEASGNPLFGALTGGAGGLATGALTAGVGNASGIFGGEGGAATSSVGAGTTGTGAGASAIAAPASAGVPDVGSGFIGSPELGGQIASGLPSVGGASSTASAFPVFSSGGYFDTTTGPASGAGAGGGASVPAGTNLPESDLSNLASTAAGNVATGGGSGGISGFINNLFGSGSSGGSSSGSFDNLFGSGTAGGGSSGGSSGGIGSLLKDVAPLVSLGGVGMQLLRGNQTPALSNPEPYAASLSSSANKLNTQGTQLASYLQSGTLPPGVQQSINQAAEAAKAQIRSKYASMGGGDTSAMVQDLANVDQMAATQGTQIATNLLQTGISETGLSAELYDQLLRAATAQNAALSQSIGNFASALAGQPTILRAA